jgi:serine/threonine protein kinase
LFRLVYSNLKPKNILVDKQDYIKIIDFNCTNFISLEFKVYISLYRQLFNSKAELKERTVDKLSIVERSNGCAVEVHDCQSNRKIETA